MSKMTAESEKPIQAQFFELLGRALYVCNVIELQLRWMHKHTGGIWTGETLEELIESVKKSVGKQQKKDKIPLGPIGQDMVDAIYTPRSNKDFKEAERKFPFTLKLDYKIEWKGRFRRARKKFQKFIDARNYIVHCSARDYNLTEPESCRNAYDDLRRKCEIIKDAAEFFDEDYNTMKGTLQIFQKEMPQILKKEYAEA